MLGKVKQWFGIEGVKIELLLPEAINLREGSVEGQLRLNSMTEQEVSNVVLRVVEKYSRGRGKEKLTDEYILGEVTLQQPVKVPANEPVILSFSLPFMLAKSEIDEMGERNILLRGFASIAKSIRAAKSEYRVEAEASVMGTRLNPMDSKILNIKN